MWALTYDYLVGYTMEDMSPAPALATEWDDLRRRPHLDLHDARRRDVVRRRAADGRRRRLHLRPHPRRRPRGGDLVVVPQGRRVGRGTRRHDGRAHPEEAERRAAAAADPDRARAHLEGRLREGHQELRGRADGRPAGGRLRSRSGWSRAPPAARPTVRGQPRLLERCAARRRGGLPRLQERGPGGAGADQGRGRLRRQHLGAPGAVARGRGGHHGHTTATRRASTRSPSTPARSTSRPASRSATPTPPCSTRRSGSP